ncbi:MAG: PQQ-binding-like beta-propeller repeat protein, partial [Thermoplasmata archaeon]|nr:PQQ-binding-like beta-propeller repeat protein [Thermoplasmata archaeon]
PYRYLCAINMYTGEEVWTRSLPMGGTTPAVRDGMVFVGIAGNQGHYNRMYAFDEKTGEEIWSFLPRPNLHNNDITSSPAVANGMVYFGSWNARLFAVDEFTGEEVWNYTAMHWIQTSPAVAYGKVFFGDNARNIYAIDAMTGEHLWSYTGTQWILSSPAAANGMVFVGDNGGYFYALDENGIEDGDQGVPDCFTHPLDRSDLIWMKKIGDNGIRSSPAVHNGKVFIASSDGILFALDMDTGDEIWQRRIGDYNQGESVHSSPAVADGKVYIGSGDKNVYALDEETGQILWKYKTTKYVRSSPAVAGGMVYVPDHNGYLYAFGMPAEPDLALSREDILFPKKPTEGDIVKIEARIHNIGHRDAESADVIFYDGNPDNGGERIGDVQTISVVAQGCRLASVEWDTTGKGGEQKIYVRIRDCIPEESDLGNNNATRGIWVNHPPYISPEIPDPPEVDEDNEIRINLTDYENDEEDSGVNLSWIVTDYDEDAIEAISGERSDNDVLTFTPRKNYYGTTTVELTLVDKDGGTDSQSIELTWRNINDPPDVAITEPDEGDAISGICEIKGNASDVDGDGQIEKVEIRIEDGGWEVAKGTTDWSCEIDTTTYDDGNYIIYARAFDGEEYSEAASIELIFDNQEEPGNHRPTIEITEPKDGSIVNGTITIIGRAEDEDGNEDLENIEVKVGNGSWQEADGTADWSFEVNTTKYGDGSYTVYARAFDGEDYSETASIELVFDNKEEPGNHRPTIEITEPESGGVIKGIITIKGKADDEDGNEDIENVEVKVENKNWKAADGTSDWCLELDTRDYGDGIYRIYAKAYDGKDYSEIVSIELEFDNEEEPQEENHPPTIEVSAEKLDDYNYRITWQAADPDGDPLKIDLYYDTDTNPDNGRTFIIEDLDNTGSYDWGISDMGEGDYYILAVARDPGGGEGSDYSEKITISLPVFAPDFKVLSIKALSSSFEPGNAVVINAVIRNQGSIQGAGSVEFLVDEVRIWRGPISLGPGDEKTVVAIWTAVEGNHTITVRVSVNGDSNPNNNEAAQVISVAGSQQKKESDDEFPVLYAGLALAVIGVVVGVLAYRKRPKARCAEGRMSPQGSSRQVGEGRCPRCGSKTQYSEAEDDCYCWECEEYVGEMEEEVIE